jgi:hypothetical protein
MKKQALLPTTFFASVILLFALASCSAPVRVDEAVLHLAENEVFKPNFIDIGKALKRESKIHKIEDLDIQDGFLHLSASGNLISENLSAKIFSTGNKKYLVAVLATTNIIHSQESLSGLEGPVPAYTLKIEAFEYRAGSWENATETVIPKDLATFLADYYNFDLNSSENALPISAHFRKDLLVLQSQELKVDKIVSLLWKGDHMVIHEAVKTLKMKNVHPALGGLEPKDTKTGLLLGVATKDGYKSYWLVFHNETAELRAEFDYVINRQEDDFYFIDRVKFAGMSYCSRQKCMQSKSEIIFSKNFEDFSQKRKIASSKIKLDVEKNDKCMASVREQEVVAVGKGFMVLQVKNSAWGCVEESQSAFDSAYYVLRAFAKTFDPKLSSYINSSRLKDAEQQLLRKALANSKNDDLTLSELGTYTTFYIKREKGTVSLYAMTQKPTRNAFSYGAPSFRPCDTYVSVAPNMLAKNAEFPLKYDVLLGYVKELRDCLVSPSENIVCILDDREMRCLEPTGKNVLFTLPLYKEIQPHIISADWVTGDETDIWNEFLEARYKATQADNLQTP